MRNLRQDTTQNNEQISNTNDFEIFKNEILQIVKQEVQNLKTRDNTK